MAGSGVDAVCSMCFGDVKEVKEAEDATEDHHMNTNVIDYHKLSSFSRDKGCVIYDSH